MSLADRVALVIDALDGEISRAGGDTNVYGGAGGSATSPARTEARMTMGLTRLEPGSYTVLESDDLSGVDNGQAVTVPAGETKTVVEAEAIEGRGLILMAIGATDQPECEYSLYVDNKQYVGGRMNSPFGLVADPFSFVDALNGYIYGEESIQYRVTNTSSSDVEIAGRMHVRQ